MISDHQGWQYTSTGIYSVKSGYKVAMGYPRLQSEQSFVWWCLWDLPIPPRVRLFLWRACQDILPTRLSLFRRHIIDESLCPMCDGADESTMHALLYCPAARAIWLHGALGPVNHTESSFLHWWSLFIEQSSPTVCCQAAVLLWSIWNNRNDRFWGHRCSSAVHVVQQGLSFLYQ